MRINTNESSSQFGIGKDLGGSGLLEVPVGGLDISLPFWPPCILQSDSAISKEFCGSEPCQAALQSDTALTIQPNAKARSTQPGPQT